MTLPVRCGAAVIAVGLLLSMPASAQDPGQARFDALVALAEAKLAEYKVPGMAIGVIDAGIVRTRGLGVINVEDRLAVTDHTVFPIASISKTFAATAMMRLVEQGKVSLQAPVRTYLPEFKVSDETVSREATIWNLLTHTGGWEGQVSGPERGEDTLRNFVSSITGLMQVAPPAAAWSYNNAGFSIAGRVIESVTGTSINRAIRDLVFTPLGLEHAGTTAGDFIVNRFAAGHANRGDAPPALQRPFSPSVSVTAGGIGLCITDLMTYAKFHMGDGSSARGERVLTPQSLSQMRTPQMRKQSTDDEIGLAWHLRTIGGLRVAAHGGTLAGHILLLEIAPERNFAIAILTNAQNGWRLIQDVERAALQTYQGASFAPNQGIAHRGLVETLPTATPLTTQPNPAAYVGRYLRPSNAVVVRAEGSSLFVQERPNAGEPRAEMPIAFFGPDRAVVIGGAERGQSIEFIRDAGGAVQWIRVVGRVAVRTAP